MTRLFSAAILLVLTFILLPRIIKTRGGREATLAVQTDMAKLPPSENSEVSQYGRIPLGTLKLFSSHVRDVCGPIISYLPLNVSREMRDFTVKTLLDYLLRDWRVNQNTENLTLQDIKDLGSFAEFAYFIAETSSKGDEDRDSPRIKLAVYKAVLTALLNDWLENWNTDGIDGPAATESLSKATAQR